MYFSQSRAAIPSRDRTADNRLRGLDHGHCAIGHLLSGGQQHNHPRTTKTSLTGVLMPWKRPMPGHGLPLVRVDIDGDDDLDMDDHLVTGSAILCTLRGRSRASRDELW